MRPVLVVPGEERSEFPAKGSLALRDHDPARCLVFHRPDEAFDKGDSAVLSNRPVPRTDRFPLAPALERRAPENAVFVADQRIECGLGSSNRPSKKRAYRARVRPL